MTSEDLKTILRDVCHGDHRAAESLYRICMEDVLGRSVAHGKVHFEPGEQQKLLKTVQRLKMGEPIQFITGIQYFYGHPFRVGPGVLIPRPETEELVEQCLKLIDRFSLNNIIDIGTGSGVIPITIQRKTSQTRIWGMDISEKAIAYAKQNDTGGTISWMIADIGDENTWRELPLMDLIISNPPYVLASDAFDANAIRFEPDQAIYAPDDDPLHFYRHIEYFAKRKLNRKGWIALELNEYLAERIQQFYLDAGWDHVQLIKDLQNKNRILLVQ